MNLSSLPIERHPDVAHVLLAPDEIAGRVSQLGAVISRDYADRDPLLVGVLKGVFPFLADLSRAIATPHTVDFLAVCPFSQRGECGTSRILKDLEEPAEGRHIILVEDIVDTGKTLFYLVENLRVRSPASLRICALLDKPERRQVPIEVDYVGFEIPDTFVVGYGLDFAEGYRNLPFVGVLKQEVITRRRLPAGAQS